jgi:hypothetical protein
VIFIGWCAEFGKVPLVGVKRPSFVRDDIVEKLFDSLKHFYPSTPMWFKQINGIGLVREHGGVHVTPVVISTYVMMYHGDKRVLERSRGVMF